MDAAEKKRELIIIVDDDATNLTVARNNLMDKYDIFTAPSGLKLFQLLKKVTPDLILLDIEMPDMDGYEAIKLLKSVKNTANIPVIFLTSKINPECEVKGLDLGAVDYITKPFSKELLIKRIDSYLLLEKQKKELWNYNRNLKNEVDKKSKTVLELQNAIMKTVSELVECRDNITGGHIERTQHYLRLLVDFLLKQGVYTSELSSWDIDQFVMSSQLHDVGKIAIKDDILMKTDKLTSDEFEEIKKHAVLGMEIIRNIRKNTDESAFLRHAEILAGSHHEKWNGTGYPYGLKGSEIPLQGRLMAIVDVYDALTNNRPYKRAFSHEEAIKVIKDGIGTHFDPLIDEVFVANEKVFKSISSGKTVLGQEGKPQPENRFSALLEAAANIADIRNRAEDSNAEKARCYLEIFVETMMTHERFKEEVSTWDIDLLLMSAQLCDDEKMEVPDQILNKKDMLAEGELEDVKSHADLIENADDDSLRHHDETAIYNHREKWDGTGRPLGLKGEEIPLQCRIMAVVCVYNALTTGRPNREKVPHEEAVSIIKNCSGTHFDPEIVEIFIEQEKEFEKVRAAWSSP